MRMIIAFCLVLLVTAINGGAVSLAQSLDDTADASSAVAFEQASPQSVLENCCDGEADKVVPRSATSCGADCQALIPTVAPTPVLKDGQGGMMGSYGLTGGPGQPWQRPPRT